MKKNNFIYLSNLLIIFLVSLSTGCGSKSSYYDQVALVAKDDSKGDLSLIHI